MPPQEAERIDRGGSPREVGQSEFINRLLALIEEATDSYSIAEIASARATAWSMVIDAINRSTQKQVHDLNSDALLARRVVVYTWGVVTGLTELGVTYILRPT